MLCLLPGGDGFGAGQVRRQELPGSVQGGGRFVEDGVKGLEYVRHPGGDVEGNRHVGSGGLPGEADGIVEQDLMGPGLDDEGRPAGQVGEDGADQAKSRVLPRRVVGGPVLEALPAEQRVGTRFVSMVAPAKVRSAYGDINKAAAAAAGRDRGH